MSSPVLAGVRAAVKKVAVDVGDDIRRFVVGEAELAIRRLFEELSQRSRVLAIAEHAERVLQDEGLGPQPEDQADGSSADGVCRLEVSRGGGLGP